jgi:hypothetical protein
MLTEGSPLTNDSHIGINRIMRTPMNPSQPFPLIHHKPRILGTFLQDLVSNKVEHMHHAVSSCSQSLYDEIRDIEIRGFRKVRGEQRPSG